MSPMKMHLTPMKTGLTPISIQIRPMKIESRRISIRSQCLRAGSGGDFLRGVNTRRNLRFGFVVFLLVFIPGACAWFLSREVVVNDGLQIRLARAGFILLCDAAEVTFAIGIAGVLLASFVAGVIAALVGVAVRADGSK
jgi:hypothetical protein